MQSTAYRHCRINYLSSVLLGFAFIMLLVVSAAGQANKGNDAKGPLRLGIIGLVHDHVHGAFQNMHNPDIEIVGIAEPDTAVVERYVKQYHLNRDIIYATAEEMIAKTKPEAVSVFTPISDHIKIVRLCAPHHIDVMVEKPLAINYAQAKEMKALAEKWGIKVITNYETTWYPVTKDSYEKIIDEKLIGDIRKMVVHDGHQGPVEIGCSKDFLKWLTDPVLNGGGAITDFGCYGTDLISYLMKGERPLSVTAVAQQVKPKLYPKVDDEATIIVSYPRAQAILQASWNWPFGRKDMEVYGKTGYIITRDNVHMRMKTSENSPEQLLSIDTSKAIAQNPFSFLASVIRGTYQLSPGDPSSLELNLVAMEILDAAVRSSKEGKTIYLK
ncbi:MAG: Gfo/Idh/MocA family oxidoreductase [Ginsengibacter sp.]